MRPHCAQIHYIDSIGIYLPDNGILYNVDTAPHSHTHTHLKWSAEQTQQIHTKHKWEIIHLSLPIEWNKRRRSASNMRRITHDYNSRMASIASKNHLVNMKMSHFICSVFYGLPARALGSAFGRRRCAVWCCISFFCFFHSKIQYVHFLIGWKCVTQNWIWLLLLYVFSQGSYL